MTNNKKIKSVLLNRMIDILQGDSDFAIYPEKVESQNLESFSIDQEVKNTLSKNKYNHSKKPDAKIWNHLEEKISVLNNPVNQKKGVFSNKLNRLFIKENPFATIFAANFFSYKLPVALIVIFAILFFANTYFFHSSSIKLPKNLSKLNVGENYSINSSGKISLKGLNIHFTKNTEFKYFNTSTFEKKAVHILLNKGSGNFSINSKKFKKSFFVWFPGGYLKSIGTKFKIIIRENTSKIILLEGKIFLFQNENNKFIPKGVAYAPFQKNISSKPILKNINQISKIIKQNSKLDTYKNINHDLMPPENNLKLHNQKKTKPKKLISSKTKKPKNINPKKITKFYLINGDQISGEIISSDKIKIIIKTDLGKLNIKKAEIKKMKKN